MNLLFVVDARSPTALNWMRHFLDGPDEVHVVSTYPADAPEGAASFRVVPVAFSSAAGSPAGGGNLLKRWTSPRLRTMIRQWFGIWTLQSASRRLGRAMDEIRPDLVHAMRVPYEGMLAALACARQPKKARPPLLISIWGNDFTLHAQSNGFMASRTRMAMRSADAVHADCRRDIRLAHEWGFPVDFPSTVLPGGGGVQADIFYPDPNAPLPDQPLTIIQPRGIRAYVQNEAFFQAIPQVIANYPEVMFVCPAMAGEPLAEQLVTTLDLHRSVRLLPNLPRPAMAGWFRKSTILVSPTTHDGTPNTLLEGLACGCFPVAGNIESIREWIVDGENGLLVDPESAPSIAQGILRAIESPELREHARTHNAALIRQRAAYGTVMHHAGDFYRQLIRGA